MFRAVFWFNYLVVGLVWLVVGVLDCCFVCLICLIRVLVYCGV